MRNRDAALDSAIPVVAARAQDVRSVQSPVEAGYLVMALRREGFDGTALSEGER